MIGRRVEYGYGPKCFPTILGALTPQKIAVCPVPLCGKPSTPKRASAGKIKELFDSITWSVIEGVFPNILVKVLNGYLKNGLF